MRLSWHLTLRHPDDFLAVVHVRAKPPARPGEAWHRGPVVEEGAWALVDEHACLRAEGAHLDDPKRLVSALVVLERERAAVRPPPGARNIVRGWEEHRVDYGGSTGRKINDDGLIVIDVVSRLAVIARDDFRLQLIRWRGLHERERPQKAGHTTVDRELLRVRRPDERRGRIRVPLGAVVGQPHCVGRRRAGRTNHHVELLDARVRPAVRRCAYGIGGRAFPGSAAPLTAAALVCAAPVRCLGDARADVVSERAAPARRTEFDRLRVLRERQRRER
jgi:hypothetical protein